MLERVPPQLRMRLSEDPETGCWVWTGRLNRNGYGRAWWKGREPVAHRAVWEAILGTIPTGTVLDHLCRNRACCNPKHLEPVTVRENTLRGTAVLFVKEKCHA